MSFVLRLGSGVLELVVWFCLLLICLLRGCLERLDGWCNGVGYSFTFLDLFPSLSCFRSIHYHIVGVYQEVEGRRSAQLHLGGFHCSAPASFSIIDHLDGYPGGLLLVSRRYPSSLFVRNDTTLRLCMLRWRSLSNGS